MAIKRKYRLNLRNYGNLPAIMLSQYDEGYELEFEIRDGTEAASDLSAYTAVLKGTRADTLSYSFTGTISTNVLAFVIDTTMTACAGRGTAEIAIEDTANNVLFATFNMPVFVERAAVPEGSIDADVERAQEIAEQIQEIVDTAAETVSGEAEKWATGKIGGSDVPPTDPAYENNAKYYAEQAETAEASIGIDATLTQAGKAADAKVTGDAIGDLKSDLSKLEVEGLSAVGAEKGSAPIADGNGDWAWSSLYKDQLDEINIYLGSVDSLNWGERMAYVREGKGRGLFPSGTQFYVPHGVLGTMLWDVVAHDHFINPANPSGHTMTLMTHYSYQDNHNNVCLNNVIYYASEGLKAGSYSFVVHGRATRTVDNGKRAYFTIVNDIPVGGQIRPLNLIYNTPMEGATAGVYANARSSEKLEEITFTLTPISGAIDLGTAGNGDLNNSGCVDDGIPDYDISDIRQWLNSDGDVGEWWSPQHKFCCTYYDGWAGAYGGIYTKDFILTKPAFLHDIDSTFLSYVCAVDYPTVSSAGFSATHELREIYTVRDKFTLPASMEVGVSAPADNVNVGTCFEYFSNVDDTKRIKPRGPSLSANRGWWCRNASTSGDPNTLRGITTKGKIERRGICSTGAFVFMCTLA